MTVWRPWDADDNEYAARLEIKQLVPNTLRPFLSSWLYDQLNNVAPGYTKAESVHILRSALGVELNFAPGFVDTEALVERIVAEGDRYLIRVVDYLASAYSLEGSDWRRLRPAPIDDLAWHLDQNMSSVHVALVDNENFRIERRLPLGVEESASAAVESAKESAGRHLAKAWMRVRDLNPDPSVVMTEAIRAVEAAAGPVVTPKEKQFRLGKIVQQLKDRSSWTLVLDARDDGHPDHRLVLIGMIETLVFAERGRHGGAEPSELQALTHVQLASTLVAWFSTGAVVNR